jgi:hypothetical protein
MNDMGILLWAEFWAWFTDANDDASIDAERLLEGAETFAVAAAESVRNKDGLVSNEDACVDAEVMTEEVFIAEIPGLSVMDSVSVPDAAIWIIAVANGRHERELYTNRQDGKKLPCGLFVDDSDTVSDVDKAGADEVKAIGVWTIEVVEVWAIGIVETTMTDEASVPVGAASIVADVPHRHQLDDTNTRKR